MEFKTYGIPKALATRIERIYALLGYPTPSAFVQEAIRLHVEKKEWEFERIEQEREAGRKVLGTDRDEGDL